MSAILLVSQSSRNDQGTKLNILKGVVHKIYRQFGEGGEGSKLLEICRRREVKKLPT